VTLVLLHAFPLDERMWEPLGRDGAVTPRLYDRGNSMDEWAAAVLEEVEGPFLACGTSMGGYCALAIARRAPERLTGLVLAGARIDADSPERRDGRADTIGVPLVMAVGEHDPFISVEEARASGGRLHVFDEVGHLPALERPDEFNSLLDELL
jgi:pimeloyl-ACP methyl ester carboxylesterase